MSFAVVWCSATVHEIGIGVFSAAKRALAEVNCHTKVRISKNSRIVPFKDVKISQKWSLSIARPLRIFFAFFPVTFAWNRDGWLKQGITYLQNKSKNLHKPTSKSSSNLRCRECLNSNHFGEVNSPKTKQKADLMGSRLDLGNKRSRGRLET